MGALGIFIKSALALINFLRENRTYKNSIPKSVLFWCAIASLMNNIYQYNAIVLAEKELDNKRKYILQIERSVNPDDDVGVAVIKKLEDLNNKVDDLKRQSTSTSVINSSPSTIYNRYEILRLSER